MNNPAASSGVSTASFVTSRRKRLGISPALRNKLASV